MGNQAKTSVIRCCNPKCTVPDGAVVATLGTADIAGSPRWFRREGLVYCEKCRTAKWADPPDGRQARNQDALTGWTWNGPQGPPSPTAAKATKATKEPELEPDDVTLPEPEATEPDDVTLPEPEPEPAKRAPKPGKSANPAAKPADPPAPPATVPEPPVRAPLASVDVAIDAAADVIARAIGARFAASLRPRVAASVSEAIVTAIRDAGAVQ